ncbi:hypothetical protein WME75_22045 [Sorangium sp. So ce1014]|uniref:hypothetical protein n=1 Tax=Sorangium sp. So ce1014 TaxID=3133326 RepID=UPI003F63288B
MTSMNTTDPGAEAPVPVPQHVRSLLLALAYGWKPTPVTLGPVEQIRYNGKDFSELAPVVLLQTDRLVATLGGSRFYTRIDDLMRSAQDGELDGVFAGGGTFHGEMILRVAHVTGPHGPFTVEAASWTVLTGEAPSLWIGRIEGAVEINFGGNMVVERIPAGGFRGGHRRHFRLSGTYTYYLVQGGVRGDPVWHLLIDTGAGMPDTEMLGHDFLLLQFVLGCQLRMPELLGVTPDCHTVAAMAGTGARRNLLKRSVPPVPIERSNDEWVDEAWAVIFFERVSVAWANRPKWRAAYWMAFDSYLDAMTLHLDVDYLRLQIALEAFSYWALQHTGQEERVVVKDRTAWKKWVRDNESVIRELASAGFEDSLFNKVMGVYRLSSGRIVPSAFLAYGVKLTSEMVAELGGRDVVVHQGFMAPAGYDGERELRRIALVRTMLVALIAWTVDYRGAINGWEIGHLGYPLEPQDWWSVCDCDRRLARRTFVVEESMVA